MEEAVDVALFIFSATKQGFFSQKKNIITYSVCCITSTYPERKKHIKKGKIPRRPTYKETSPSIGSKTPYCYSDIHEGLCTKVEAGLSVRERRLSISTSQQANYMPELGFSVYTAVRTSSLKTVMESRFVISPLPFSYGRAQYLEEGHGLYAKQKLVRKNASLEQTLRRSQSCCHGHNSRVEHR